MPNTSTEKIQASEDVLSQVIRDETVLLDLKTEQYYGLDDVGSRIWALIKKGASRGDMVTVLAREYQVSEDELHKDVELFISSLADAGLLAAFDTTSPAS